MCGSFIISSHPLKIDTTKSEDLCHLSKMKELVVVTIQRYQSPEPQSCEEHAGTTSSVGLIKNNIRRAILHIKINY